MRRGSLPKQLQIPRPRDMRPRRRASGPDEVRQVIAKAWGEHGG